MPAPEKTDAVSLLKADHRKVEELFDKFENAKEARQKQALVREICIELCIHATIEEEIFYPACKGLIKEEAVLEESYVEHDSAKVLISELLNGAPDDAFYDAKVSVLSEMIKHHVKEEERPSEGLFAQAKAADLDFDALGARLLARKQALQEDFTEEADLPPPETRSFTGHELVEGEPVPDSRRPVA